MHKMIIAAALTAVLVTACAPASQGPETAARSDVLYREAVVETVDQESRQILLTGQNGNRLSFVAGPEVRNLAQVGPGDRVRLGYYEAVAARIADPGDPGGAIEVFGSERAAPGERPEFAAAGVLNLVVDFISYDPKTAVATFVTPDGVLHAAQIHPRMREFVAARQPGERIEVTIEQAVAVSVEEF